MDADRTSLKSSLLYGANEGTEGQKEAMKYAGLLVMPTGFLLCVAAILLFPASTQRTIFVLSGLAVEFLGLAVAIRGHMKSRKDLFP